MWKARTYYVFRNKTSNKHYVGQSACDKVGITYFGSGVYWNNHCKSNGGKTLENLELLEKVYFETEESAQQWLDEFESKEGEYWLEENTKWANLVKEDTNDSPFAEYNKQRTKDGTNHLAVAAWCEKALAEGKHNFQVANPSPKLIDEGKHNFQTSNPAKVRYRCTVTGKITRKSTFTQMARSRGFDQWPHKLEKVT